MALPVAWRRESRPLTTQPSRRRAGRGGAGVGVDAGGSPPRRRGGRAQLVVVGVEDVDVGVGREVGGQGHAEQATVPEVVDVDVQVGEGRRRGVGQGVEDLDDPALLGHEDAPVRGEADHGRVAQPAEDDRLLEAGRRGRPGRRRGRRHQGGQRPEHQGHREHDGQDAVAVGGTATATGSGRRNVGVWSWRPLPPVPRGDARLSAHGGLRHRRPERADSVIPLRRRPRPVAEPERGCGMLAPCWSIPTATCPCWSSMTRSSSSFPFEASGRSRRPGVPDPEPRHRSARTAVRLRPGPHRPPLRVPSAPRGTLRLFLIRGRTRDCYGWGRPEDGAQPMRSPVVRSDVGRSQS